VPLVEPKKTVSGRPPALVTVVLASVLLTASCSWMPDMSFMPDIPFMSSDEDKAAANAEKAEEKVAKARMAEERVEEKEETDVKKERSGEKAEDKDFEKLREQLERDLAKTGTSNGKMAAEKAGDEDEQRQPVMMAKRVEPAKPTAAEKTAGSTPATSVSEKTFDEDMLAINKRVHSISERVEKVSDRVHRLAGMVEHLPSGLAEVKQSVARIEEKLEMAKSAGGSAPAQPVMAKPKSLLSPAKAPAKPAAKMAAFWGVQLGAYSTRASAENAWSEMLLKSTAEGLIDAKVYYHNTGPRKKGKPLNLIVINSHKNRKAAKAACKSLKGQGVDCVAAYIKP